MQRPTASRIVPAAALLALIALALAACGGNSAGPGEPRLLASAYEATRSRLVLIDPEQPNGPWAELAAIEHADGWDVEGVVAPSGRAAALLALPPGRSQPRSEAVLWLVTADQRRVLATGLDLYAGLAFSDDGERIAVARNAGGQNAGSRLEVLRAADGASAARYEADEPTALYPIELRGKRLWAAALESSGWALWALTIGADGGMSLEQRWPLGRGSQRRWTISPDGDELAMEVREGAAFRVAVRSLGGEDRLIANAAAPAWRPDGELTVGRWGGEGGFMLPIAWDAGGRWLAVTAYDGKGPGDAGRARLGIVGAKRGLERVERADLYAIGWWTG